MLRLIAGPAADHRLAGEVALPVSVAHAHRALILGALAEGCSTITGRSDALHLRTTLAALRRLGVRLAKERDGYRVWGGPFRPTQPRISAGACASTLELLLGLSCRAVGPELVISGQRALHRRRLAPLAEALQAMGVTLEADGDVLPVTIRPGRPRGGAVVLRHPDGEWLDGLLLLAPLASEDVELSVAEPWPSASADLTIRLMTAWGVEVGTSADGRRFRVAAGQRYRPAAYRLPPDLAAAAYPLVASALLPADVLFRGLTRHPEHPAAAILDVLAAGGVELLPDPAGRGLRLRSQGRPQGVHVDCGTIPELFPLLAVYGALAGGRTLLEHVGAGGEERLRGVLQLRRMGVRIDQPSPDQLLVHGGVRPRAAVLSAFGDEHLLMALALAGAMADGRTEITHPHAYRLAYPEFLDQMRALGLPLAVEPADEAPVGPWSTTPSATGAPELRNMMPRAWIAAQRASGTWPDRLITDHLEEAAAWTPDRPAVVDSSGAADHVLSYRELQQTVDRLATALLRQGVRPGEVVAFQLPNWWEFTVLQLALVRCGAVSCPLMPIFRERELAFMLTQSRARLLVVPAAFRHHDHAAMAERLRAEVPTLERVLVVRGSRPGDDRFESLLDTEADPALLARARPAPDAIVQLLYTSGTSGQPKGVLHTHNTLLAALQMHLHHYRLTDRSTVLIPSPAGHQTGFLYGMWLALALGATAVYQDVWNAEKALSLMDAWRVSFVQASTPFLTDLVEAARRRGRPPAGLHIFVATGAPVPRILARLARAALRCEVMGGWGTTESGLVAGGAPGDAPDRLWQTDGRVLPPQEMRVVDADGRDVAPGTEGRFLVRTPAMFVGYLGHADWYAHAFVGDRWFDTGDLATLDADGYMRITGRTKDVINRGGEKIPVAEIEECLYAHPAVAEVAVVAMPDPRLGERACACVVLRPGQTLGLRDVQRHLEQARMAKQYWPERLEVVASMPRTPSGKIQKYLLRQRIAELVASEAATPART